MPTTAEIVGSWRSAVHPTEFGRMAFVLRVGSDGRFSILGEADKAGKSDYRRDGEYRFANGWFVSAAINEGRPARLVIVKGEIVFSIDDFLTITFARLNTPPPSKLSSSMRRINADKVLGLRKVTGDV